MTSKRTEQLRRMLSECRQSIGDSIRGHLTGLHRDGAAAKGAGAMDAGEVADCDLEADIELVFLEVKIETLRRIDDALARLNRGLYGQCVECGSEIPTARLRALPFAVRCVECEDGREVFAKRARASRRRPVRFPDALDGVN